MAVPTYGRKDRLDHLVLMMQVGHLHSMPRDERRVLIAELCDEQGVEEHLNRSFSDLDSFDEVPPAHIRALQNGIRQSGKLLGQELVAAGYYSDQYSSRYPGELSAAVAAKIRPYISRRIGDYEKESWKRGWHVINVGLFLFASFVSVVDGGMGTSDVSFWPWFSWLASVTAMWNVRLSKRVQANSATRKDAYLRKYAVLEQPLLEGIDDELKKAGKHRELEDLVMNRSWPGRGMPGNEPYKPPKSEFEEFPEMGKPNSSRRKQRQSSYTLGSSQASSAKRAERLCADWLRSRGERSAETTKDGADGGIDIISNRYVAQVKNYKGSVPVQAIREIHGVASATGRKAMFFTSGNYTKEAINFANSVDMPLIKYDAILKKFEGVNSSGRRLA